MNELEKTALIDLIKSIEVRIDKNSKIPHVVLNGVDFKNEQIGLRGLHIAWDTCNAETPRGIVRVDYLQREGNNLIRETSVSQSFEGGFIKRE